MMRCGIGDVMMDGGTMVSGMMNGMDMNGPMKASLPAKDAQAALSPDEEERLEEALAAKEVADQLAAEAKRSWQEAQKTTQQLKRDRGFGHVNTVNNDRC